MLKVHVYLVLLGLMRGRTFATCNAVFGELRPKVQEPPPLRGERDRSEMARVIPLLYTRARPCYWQNR